MFKLSLVVDGVIYRSVEFYGDRELDPDFEPGSCAIGVAEFFEWSIEDIIAPMHTDQCDFI